MEGKNTESYMASATAYVDAVIKEANYDTCSICLDDFGESNPSTVTTCRHEYHRQCLLEWYQRSSQCPLCWQSISLKDPSSQELLEAVERERTLGNTPSRNAATFRHRALGDFEMHRLPVGVNDVDFEQRIIQHLTAAATSIGRAGAHHLGRREGQRARPSSGHGCPQFLVFSTQPRVPTSDRDEPSQQISHLRTRSDSLPARYTLMAINHQQV